MKSIPLALPTQSNPAKYGHAGRTRLVNLYATSEGVETKSDAQLHPVYGLTDYVTLLAGKKVRGLISVGSELLAVCGRFLWRVDTSGSVTNVGGIPADGPVQMVRNRRLDAVQTLIVVNGRAYVYQAGIVTEVADPDYAAAFGVTVFNGYGILPGTNGRWQISGLDDFTAFDPLEFANANSLPDEIVRAINIEGGIAFLGEASTEYWTESGAEDFPFTRSTVREFGCASAASVTRVDRAVGFIAQDRTVRLMGGYEAPVISNPGVDRWLDNSDLTTVDAFAWQAEGHTFYSISTSTGTFVFDLKTGKWHERESYGYARWRATAYVYHNGRHIVGDDTGKLYVMSKEAMTEAGQPLICDIQPAPVDTFPDRAIVHRLHLDVVPGVGMDAGTTDELTDPQIAMSTSDDGGRNFGTERTRPLGGEGDYRRRVQWHRLGLVRSTGRIWRFRMAAPVARAVLAASMQVERLAP